MTSMMKINDEFLEAFRNLENELRDINLTVLEYENSLKDTSIQEKLKLCRITRNYLVHQDNSFITASKEYINFISKLTTDLRLKSKIVKNVYKKIKPIYPTEAIKNIVPLCAKNTFVPIVDKKSNKLLYIVDSEILVKNLAKGNKKIDIKKSKYKYISEMSKVDKLSGLYVVTDDGTENGLYLGILNI